MAERWRVMKVLSTFVQTKTVTLLALVSMIANGGNLWGWWSLTVDQIAWVNTVAGAVLVLFGAQTVTANKRLTGKWLGPAGGVTPVEVVEHMGDG